jgi:lipopolysaccharide export system permease protein
MLIIDRYILRTVALNIVLVVAVLLALSSLITFVGQLDNVGKGAFGIVDALSYVVLMQPQTAFEMMPVAALLGSLFGLSRLAVHSELVVLRAAGAAPIRLAGSVLLVGLLVGLLTAMLGELIAPPLKRYAESQRALAKFADVNLSNEQSIWLVDEGMIINARPRSEQNWSGGVYVFGFDAQRNLTSIGRAESADLGPDERWRLLNLVETDIGADQLSTDASVARTLSARISPELIRFSEIFPDNMTVRSLARYIAYLKQNGLDSQNHEIALWSRIASVTAVVTMTLLALPFAFGFQRVSGTGVRMAVGVIIGLVYFLASRTLANSGQVFDLNPVVIGWLPAALIALVTVIGLARLR